MWKDLAVYIIRCSGPGTRVVEVGAGRFLYVSDYIRKHSKVDLVLTDIKPSHGGIVCDDITSPRMDLYRGASVIYSIRPPGEIHSPLMRVANAVGARLIIKPLTGEDIVTERKMKLVNYGRTYFYEYLPQATADRSP
ncbi:hypothetical protein DNK57_06135 [Methanothermobacter thermautotrophicus]|jgi:uncharacterized UPF0146 family protein|uniref:UPF0146 protein C7452_0369 n=2 Tax=Methanothermobacter TaxID=145260 RepID=A0A371NCX5_9EURY|nr:MULTISPECIES: UPF0146 family protein [Methanothermobacter]MBE2900375.1 hypothetical protein [Methanothermobacter thermautotrophicus]REE28361.1 hypothetical protein C7452_0369 [Methanothermobacter defluvii]